MTLKVSVAYRDELAKRLGVSPSRLHLDLRQSGRIVALEIYVDGKDLTPDQERIAAAFMEESPAIDMVLGVFPSRGN